jgi:hypothetical protein
MKTLHLHIGRGKTGTTLIQKFMSVVRDELAQRGVHYAYADDAGRGVGHQQFAKSFIENMPSYMTPAVQPEKVRADILDEICKSTHSDIILSSENFPLVDPARLKRFFSELPQEIAVKVILFVRSQDELAESEYNQLVKFKHITSTFQDYAEHHLEDVEYDILADRWAACFGQENILCGVYDASRRDILQRFCALLPERVTDIWKSADASQMMSAENNSLGAKALKAILLLNDLPLENRRELYQQIEKGFRGRDLPAICLDSKSAEAFRSKYSESNLRFSRKYLGRESGDLGGRRYTNEQRDEMFDELSKLGIFLR